MNNQLTYPFNNKSETKKDVFLLHNNKGYCKLYAARDSYLDHEYQYLFPLLLYFLRNVLLLVLVVINYPIY